MTLFLSGRQRRQRCRRLTLGTEKDSAPYTHRRLVSTAVQAAQDTAELWQANREIGWQNRPIDWVTGLASRRGGGYTGGGGDETLLFAPSRPVARRPGCWLLVNTNENPD